MAALTWTWNDYWEWFRQIEHDKDKTVAITELIGGGWLRNLSAHSQADVMRNAPMEILQAMRHFPQIFKLETLHIIQAELDKKNKVPKRRYAR